MTGNPIVPSRTSILETLPKVLSHPPLIRAKSSSSLMGSVYYSLRGTLRYHPWFSLFCFVGLVAGGVSFVKNYARRRQWAAGVFNMDGEKGFLGHGGGKTD